MKITVVISEKELAFVQAYTEFWRNPNPCSNCHRTDDIANCKGCATKDKWDSALSKLDADAEKKGVDKSIVTNNYVKAYMDALNAVYVAEKDVEQANTRKKNAEARLDEALSKFTIMDDKG